MEDKIKVFLQYMKKEKELRLEWDKEDGIDVEADDYKLNLLCVDRVKAFIAYRDIRIEEQWYSKLHKDRESKEVIKKLYDYDEERSRRHAKALRAMKDFDTFGEEYGLPKFYDGKMLDPKDIDKYINISIRKKETDFFLQFIDKLSRTPGIQMQKYFEEVGIEGEAKEETAFIKELQSNVESVDKKYNVDGALLEEDGNITFGDDKLIDRYTR